MTLGEKIKSLRMERELTQEALAEKLNVSRSAVAKWETNHGVPDISNLKMLSRIFDVSMDELLKDTEGANAISSEDIKSEHVCDEYAGYYYNIELRGWNDGVFDVLIVGEDDDFVFYQKKVKEQYLYGLIGKKHITSVDRTKKCNTPQESVAFEGRNYFCKKHVFVELAAKEGLIRGFFDFRSDDYRDVVVESFTDEAVSFKFGKDIRIDDISKIEELDG